MAIIPGNTRFIGISPTVDLTEKKSARLNSEQEPYTMADFQESISPDLAPISVDGESVGIAADPTATTQSVAVIQSSTTNAGLVLNPNGTGAIMANIPDGTVAGGTARGQYAVDLQMIRGFNYEVSSGPYSFAAGFGCAASGRSSIAMGERNTASGLRSTAIGGGAGAGQGVNATNSYATAVGGLQNNASGQYSGVFSGFVNTASSSYSTISGGQSNTASTGSHATVVGGYGNVASGQNSIAGGLGSVASGLSSIALGESNTASGPRSVALGRACSAGEYSIVAGNANQGTGTGSVVFGYSNNSGSRNYATISGGISNSISSNSHATVVGGSTNTASGQYSVAGGIGNVSSSQASTTFGYGNTAANTWSFAVGGFNYAAGEFSAAFGQKSSTYLQGQHAIASDRFGGTADAQQSLLTARKQDTLASAATTVLSLDGTGTTNLIIPLNNNRAWNVTVKWVAVVTSITGTATGVSVGDTMMQVDTFGFKKISGTSSMVGSANTLSTNNDTSMATAAMGYTAGTSQELKLTFTAPTFTGGGSVTCRVVAKVELTEVAY